MVGCLIDVSRLDRNQSVLSRWRIIEFKIQFQHGNPSLVSLQNCKSLKSQFTASYLPVSGSRVIDSVYYTISIAVCPILNLEYELKYVRVMFCYAICAYFFIQVILNLLFLFGSVKHFQTLHGNHLIRTIMFFICYQESFFFSTF